MMPPSSIELEKEDNKIKLLPLLETKYIFVSFWVFLGGEGVVKNCVVRPLYNIALFVCLLSVMPLPASKE